MMHGKYLLGFLANRKDETGTQGSAWHNNHIIVCNSHSGSKSSYY